MEDGSNRIFVVTFSLRLSVCLCVHVCEIHVCRYTQSPEEGNRSLEAKVSVGC